MEAAGRQPGVGRRPVLIEINPSAYRNVVCRAEAVRLHPGDQGDRDPAGAGGASETCRAKMFEQWVDWAKANRGKLLLTPITAQARSRTFSAYQLDERFGLGFTRVPYCGSAPQMIDLLAGHALFGFTQLAVAVEPARTGHAAGAGGERAETAPRCCPTCRRWRDLGHVDQRPERVVRLD